MLFRSFLYLPILAAAAPPLCILPISHCGSAPLFILPISRCGSARAFYTYQFSLRQRPRFLYCPFLVAAAPRFLYCLVLVAAAPPLFILPISRCGRSEEHTSELQSHSDLVCRLLLEKKKKTTINKHPRYSIYQY